MLKNDLFLVHFKHRATNSFYYDERLIFQGLPQGATQFLPYIKPFTLVSSQEIDPNTYLIFNIKFFPSNLYDYQRKKRLLNPRKELK